MKLVQSIFISLFCFLFFLDSSLATSINTYNSNDVDINILLKENISFLQHTKEIVLKNENNLYSEEEKIKLIKKINEEIALLNNDMEKSK